MLPIDAPPEIVITARALPTASAERLLGVTKIDGEALRDSSATGLDQILKGASGVQLFRRSDARSGQPTSQGVTLRALGGNAASRALLVLDGVPQSDPFGGWINWPAYDPASLASVRVIRGGGSVAAGPGALAGTIDLTTRDALGLAATIEGGSRNSLAANLQAGLAAGGGVITLSAYGARGDGFIPITADRRGPADRRSPYKSAGGRLRWSTPVGANVQLQATLAGFVDERERGLAFTGNYTRGADASLRLVGEGRWAWSALVYGQERRFRASAASIDPARAVANRASLQYRVPGRAVGWSAEVRPPVGSDLEVRIGTDGRLMRGSSNELGSYVGGTATRERNSGGQSAHAGLFAEATTELGAWLLSATGRIDHWRIADGFQRERLIATGLTTIDQDFADRSGWLPTARLAAGRAFGGGVRLRSAAYLGWRLPTLNELFRPFRAGQDATAANPLLSPERLRGVEAGLTWAKGPFDLSFTAFANRLTDPIANVTLGSGPGSFPGVGFVPAGGSYRQRRNLPAIDVRGIEAEARWSRGPWSASGSLSLTDAEVEADGPAAPLDGLRPAQTPSLTAAAGLRWSSAGRTVAADLRYVGDQFEDDLNRTRLPSAVTVDLFAAWPLTRSLRLTARAENLFDTLVVAGRTSDGVTERATPRTLWLGLRFSGG